MPQCEKKIEEYLQQVCEQIRLKQARFGIEKEMRAHLEDQAAAYEKKGSNHETSVIKAVEEMGDPIIVGQQLNQTYRPKMEWGILSAIAAFLLFGCIIQFTISGGSDVSVNTSGFFLKYLAGIPFGIALLMACYYFDYTYLVKYARQAMGICLLAFTVLGVSQNFTPGYTSSPSVYFVFLLVFSVVFTGFLCHMRGTGWKGLLVCSASLVIPAAVFLSGGKYTFFLQFCLICFPLLFAVMWNHWFGFSRKKGLFFIALPIMALSSLILFWKHDIFIDKLSVLLDANTNSAFYNYVGTIVDRYLSAAQMVGPAAVDFAKYPLPDWQNGYVLTYLIAHYGWLAGIAVIAVLAAMAFFLIKACIKQKSKIGFFFCLTAILCFTVQCVIMVSANLGFHLLSPDYLPLLSHGTIGFLGNLFIIGILLCVCKTNYGVCDQYISVKCMETE